MNANSYASPSIIGGNREDLRDILTIFEPEETPFTSACKKGDAPAPKEPAAKSLPYLEFSISTIALPESSKAAAKAEPVPAPLLGAVSAGAVLDTAKAMAAGAQK